MRRHLLGIIGLLLIAIGLVGQLKFSGANNQSELAGILIRSGLLLGALWLALPQLATIPPWMFGAGLLAGVFAVWNAKALAVLIFVGVIGYAILRYLVKRFLPKSSARPSTRPRSTRNSN